MCLSRSIPGVRRTGACSSRISPEYTNERSHTSAAPSYACVARAGTLLFQFAFREGVLSHLVSGSVNNLREEPEKDSAVLVNKTDMHTIQEILFSLHNISAAS